MNEQISGHPSNLSPLQVAAEISSLVFPALLKSVSEYVVVTEFSGEAIAFSDSCLALDAPGSEPYSGIKSLYSAPELQTAQSAIASSSKPQQGEISVNVGPNPRALSFKMSPILSESGAIVATVSVFAEKSDTNPMRNSSDERLQNFRTLFESCGDAISVVDNDRHIYVNGAYVKAFGFESADDIVGTPISIRFHSDHRDKVMDALFNRKPGESLPSEIYRGLRRDGAEIEVEARIVRMDIEGETRTMLFLNDRSEKLLAEKRLNEAEERLNLHLENTPLGVIEWDESFRIRAWSKQAEKIFGWTVAEAIGKTPSELNMIYADDIPQVSKLMKELQDKVFLGNYSRNRNIRSDQAVIYCEWYNSSIRASSGERLVLSLVLDVTDRIRAEDAQQEAERQQKVFLRDVLSSVTEGRLRLCDTVADLPEKLDNDSETFDLTQSDGVAKLRKRATQIAQAAGIDAERVADLEVAIGEAASNAIRHARNGRAKIAWGSEGDGCLQVWIEDEGSGISVDRLPRATLERGFTTAGSLGHGFWLMLRLADRLSLKTGQSGTTVVIESCTESADSHWLQKYMDSHGEGSLAS